MSSSTEGSNGKAREIPRVSYAQNCEDILLDRLFRDQNSGTFVDIGANHPRTDSNTYFFYLRGWRGVNLEPIPRFRELFDVERPEDLNLEAAASDSDGEIVLHEIANDADETGHSSVRDDVAETHRPLGFRVRSYSVLARTIATLVAEHAIDPPDFMTIDVEGHETAVLRGVPWERWRPKVLVIESIQSLTLEPTHLEWEQDLLRRGYLFATFNGLNRFYLREDLADRLDRLATPVNVLDRFERAELIDARSRIADAESSRQYVQREYDRLLADREWDRDNFRRIEEGWRFGLDQAGLARAAWERQAAEFEWHRANFERASNEFAADRSTWVAERDRLEQARVVLERTVLESGCELREISQRLEYAERMLAETQTELRPYRMLDRLGIVRAGFTAARRMKRKIKPRIAS